MHAKELQRNTPTAKRGVCQEAVPTGIEVRRNGCTVLFLHVHPAISSAGMRWTGIA